MDWTEEKAKAAMATLRKWRGLVAGIEPAPSPASSVIAALADDLNTAGAIAELHKLAGSGDAAGLKASAEMLGLLTDELSRWDWQPQILAATGRAEGHSSATGAGSSLFDGMERLAQKLAEARTNALQSKDFTEVDRIKSILVSAGVEVRVTKNGVQLLPSATFDPAKLEALK